jgi:hypothetical protein
MRISTHPLAASRHCSSVQVLCGRRVLPSAERSVRAWKLARGAACSECVVDARSWPSRFPRETSPLGGRPMNRDRFLLVLGANPTAWAARFEIEPFTAACRRCKRALTTSQPFAYGQLRGLLAPPCACGNKNTPYCVVRDLRYGDFFSGASEVRSPKAKPSRGNLRRARPRRSRSGTADC